MEGDIHTKTHARTQALVATHMLVKVLHAPPLIHIQNKSSMIIYIYVAAIHRLGNDMEGVS